MHGSTSPEISVVLVSYTAVLFPSKYDFTSLVAFEIFFLFVGKAYCGWSEHQDGVYW